MVSVRWETHRHILIKDILKKTEIYDKHKQHIP